MESDFENKVKKAMEKFEGKCVEVKILGIIESKFYIKNLKYEIEVGILFIEDIDESYLEIDIDDVENLYSEFTSDGYAMLIFKVGRGWQIEIQTRDNNVFSIKDKICKLVESAIAEEFCKEACGA